MKKSDVGEVAAITGGIGCFIFGVIAYLSIGPLAFQYCLWSILGKDIPWYGDMLCGWIFGEVSIPLSFVCFLLRLFLEIPLVS